MAQPKEIGKVFTYYTHVGVAGVKLGKTLKKGNNILIKGHTTNVEMKVENMQVDNKEVKEAKKGQEIGIKVPERVRPNDVVYLIK